MKKSNNQKSVMYRRSPIRVMYFTCGFLLLAAPVYSQTAADIEALLNEQAITGAQAAYFTLAASPAAQALLPDQGSGQAFALAQERGWLAATADGADAITLSRLSLLMMQAFDLDGGMMYRLTGSPRYAFRELRAGGFIEGHIDSGRRAYPNQTVSGETFLHILSNIIDQQEGEW